MQFDRDTLGPYLYRERERRGISLDTIAARTKIARSHLVKLERGDVSDWPAGIFRRAFFRAYVTAIGLDADDLLPEFLRLYPDPVAVGGVPKAAADRTSAALRITLAADEPLAKLSRARIAGACVDALAILLAAALMSTLVGHAAAAVAIIAIVYHALATALDSPTVGVWIASRGLSGKEATSPQRRSYARSSRPSRAMRKMATMAATTGATPAADSHQNHASFAHQAPVIR